MKKNLIGMALLGVVMALAPEVWGQDSSGTKVFERQVRVVMGSRETQEECREFAKVEARRAVLDQVGVYIEGRSDLMQHIRESATGLTDETDMQKRVLAIAAGVTQLEVAGEEWKSEGGALVLYLTCRVTVNPDEVAQRLAELVKDRQKVEDYERVQTEVARLRDELTRLRADLDSAKSEAQTKAARESVKGTINELTANDWFEKGLAATDPDDKIACFSFAIQLNPDRSWPYVNRGSAYGGKGVYDRAIEDFSRAIQIDPNLAIAYAGRGGAYFSTSDDNRAIADFSLALQIDPNLALACFGRGFAYHRKGDYDRAITDYSRALQIDPNDALTYYGRGTAYAYKGDYDRAITDCDRAMQLKPDYANTYNSRGLAYACKGEYDLAISDYSRALQIDPNFVQVYRNRAMMYLLKGDEFNARRDWQRAADLGDEFAKRRLEELR